MRRTLQAGLWMVLVLTPWAVAKSPVAQPDTVRPLSIAAVNLAFDEVETIEFQDRVSYSLSREILTRHKHWTQSVQPFLARTTRSPAGVEWKVVDPAQVEQAPVAVTVEVNDSCTISVE